MMNEKHRGFTLIEVMIAMAIMLIGLLAFWKMHITSTKGDAFCNQITKAVFYAEQKLEEFRAEASDNIATLTSGGDVITRDNHPEYQSHIPLRREWTVSNYSPLTDTKEITIQVGWRGAGCTSNINNCQHRIEIRTIITEH